jgi:hypothetical protein
METVALVASVFLVGLTVSGLAGAAMEAGSGERLMFRAPYVRGDRLLLSIGATGLAGPFMIVNEALAFGQDLSGSAARIAAALAVAAVWIFALGLVALAVLRGIDAI